MSTTICCTPSTPEQYIGSSRRRFSQQCTHSHRLVLRKCRKDSISKDQIIICLPKASTRSILAQVPGPDCWVPGPFGTLLYPRSPAQAHALFSPPQAKFTNALPRPGGDTAREGRCSNPPQMYSRCFGLEFRVA